MQHNAFFPFIFCIASDLVRHYMRTTDNKQKGTSDVKELDEVQDNMVQASKEYQQKMRNYYKFEDNLLRIIGMAACWVGIIAAILWCNGVFGKPGGLLMFSLFPLALVVWIFVEYYDNSRKKKECEEEFRKLCEKLNHKTTNSDKCPNPNKSSSSSSQLSSSSSSSSSSNKESSDKPNLPQGGNLSEALNGDLNKLDNTSVEIEDCGFVLV